MSELNQIRRMELAKELQDHPLLKEYWAEIERVRVEKLAKCEPGDEEVIKELLRQKNVDRNLLLFLQREINRGTVELQKLKENK